MSEKIRIRGIPQKHYQDELLKSRSLSLLFLLTIQRKEMTQQHTSNQGDLDPAVQQEQQDQLTDTYYKGSQQQKPTS